MPVHRTARDEAHLSVVRRFLAGLSHDRPSPQELAAWVQFCYRHEAYDEAAQLFVLIDPRGVDGGWYRRLRRIAAVCLIRAAEESSS